jgi:preprotein translocase subunit SecA
MSKAAAMHPSWQDARAASAPRRPDLGARLRRIGHVLGGTRRRLDADLAAALAQGETLRALDDAALDAALATLRDSVRLGRARADAAARPRALALLAEAARRSLHWRPYPRQLLAALAMHDDLLVVMPSGAGKTLAVALAAIQHAWRGRPCHVATANEYLARRDAELMRPLYQRCGLAVAAAQNMQPEQAMATYRADVVYAAGKQLLADFLRDQIVLGGVDDPLRLRLRGLTDAGGRQPVMRGLHAVIVDDAETVLFDDATTPVMISAPSDNPMLIEAVRGAHALVGHLCAGRDYRLLERRHDIEFTAEGEAALERHGELLPPLWRASERRDDLVRQAIVVRDLLQPRRHYIIQQGRLTLTDDYLGRLLARPAWTQGLHQAIEIKEGLTPTPPSRVLARMSAGSFFRRYRHFGGVGAGLWGVRDEAWRSFGRLTLRVAADTPAPAAKRCPSSIHANQMDKRAALVETLLTLHRRGQPALVSLRRITDAEAIARELAGHAVKCQLFTTRPDAGQAEALQGLAQPGQITLSLNLDACGADLPSILAGETGASAPPTSPQDVVSSAGAQLELAAGPGLRVLQFEAMELARQDRRFLDLAGRCGQPGVARQYLALDDDMFRHHLPAWCRALLARTARNTPGYLPRVARWMLRYAQHRAEKQARRQRQMQPRREALINQQLAFAGDRDMDVGAQQFGKP